MTYEENEKNKQTKNSSRNPQPPSSGLNNSLFCPFIFTTCIALISVNYVYKFGILSYMYGLINMG